MIALSALLAVAIAPSPAPTPKTIIVLKVNPLCKAVREYVAPALARMQTQDKMIAGGMNVMWDMSRMQADRADGWATLEDIHLMQLSGDLADNDTKIRTLVANLGSLKLNDAAAQAEVDEAQARLSAVARQQEREINAISGNAFSTASNELLGFRSPIDAKTLASDGASGTKAADDAARADAVQSSGSAVTAVANANPKVASSEVAVLPALAPLVERCR